MLYGSCDGWMRCSRSLFFPPTGLPIDFRYTLSSGTLSFVKVPAAIAAFTFVVDASTLMSETFLRFVGASALFKTVTGSLVHPEMLPDIGKAHAVAGALSAPGIIRKSEVLETAFCAMPGAGIAFDLGAVPGAVTPPDVGCAVGLRFAVLFAVSFVTLPPFLPLLAPAAPLLPASAPLLGGLGCFGFCPVSAANMLTWQGS